MKLPGEKVDLDTQKILELKKEKNAIILAHNYANLELHKIADMVGDSFQLAKASQEVNADIILFCGVLFMAETAKLLNPTTKVLLSHAEAGCPMADMATPEKLRDFKDNHPDHFVVCYVNSSVGVKALSDVCVTSSNAVKIVEKIPVDKPILFVPDKNLGHYVALQTGRKIDLWDGYCPIHHDYINVETILSYRKSHPNHQILLHPECQPDVLALADFIGSTKAIADYAENHDNLIIGTELGLIEMLIDRYPHKSILPLSSAAICKDMKRTTLSDVYETLLTERNEIKIEADIFDNALKPILAMIENA
jgi:quinolinate synthase